MNKIFVTGASGFIGQSLIRSLSNSTGPVTDIGKAKLIFYY